MEPASQFSVKTFECSQNEETVEAALVVQS